MSNPKFVRNEVTYITNEIDYDKLAKAIVEASNQLERDKQTTAIGATDISNGKYITEAFAKFCVAFFRSASIIISSFSVFVVGVLYSYVTTDVSWATMQDITINIFCTLALLFLIALIIYYAIILWKAAGEVSKEKDKIFMVSLFSSLICVASLIVSFVSLFKG